MDMLLAFDIGVVNSLKTSNTSFLSNDVFENVLQVVSNLIDHTSTEVGYYAAFLKLNQIGLSLDWMLPAKKFIPV